MKPHDNLPQDLRHIDVPQESMDAMARQIRALERVSSLRARMTRWSAVAAVVAVVVTAGWFLISTMDYTKPESDSSLMAGQKPSAPVREQPAGQPVEEKVTPERTDAPAPRHSKPSRRLALRPAGEKRMATNVVSQEHTGSAAPPEETVIHEDCPVMVYESGKLVACGSMESIPEVYEIFHDVVGMVESSQQVLSSGAETLDNVVKTINSSQQQ